MGDVDAITEFSFNAQFVVSFHKKLHLTTLTGHAIVSEKCGFGLNSHALVVQFLRILFINEMRHWSNT